MAGLDGLTLECHSGRATDYYGLGVRLGIYFSWLGNYMANTVLPSEFGPAADTSTIFLLTLLVAMTNDSRSRDLNQIDGLVLMHLCGGSIFGILSLWGYRTRLYRDRGPRAVRLFGGFGTHIRLAVSLGVSIFGLWFWLYGVKGALRSMAGPDDITQPPNPPECAVLYTFFFAKLRADGGIRIFYIMTCVSCILYYGVMLVVSSLAGWVSFGRLVELIQFHKWTTQNRGKYATGFSQQELTFIFKFLRVANAVWLVYSALMVEFTLNYNHITGVLGGEHEGGLQLPSQLLPFLVGLFSFIRICYQLFKERMGAPKKTAVEPDAAEAAADAGFDDLQVFDGSEPNRPGPDTQPPPPLRSDSHQARGTPLVRYLFAWLPWLGLVIRPARKSRISKLVSKGTGLSQYSQMDEVGDQPKRVV